MKRLILTLAVLLCLTAVSSAQQVTFARTLPLVGLQRTMIDSMEVVTLISVNAEGMDQSFDMTQSERKSYTESILAVNDKRVTKKKIQIAEVVERSMQPMQSVTAKTSPLTGKTYILEFLDDSVGVTTENGAEVPKEERTELLEVFSRDNEGQFGGILDGRTMTVGDTLTLKDDELAAFGAQMSDGGLKVRSASLTLKGLRESQGMQTALFDLDVVLGGARGLLEMEIAMKVRPRPAWRISGRCRWS